MLVRDRKTVVAALLTLIGYAVVLLIAVHVALHRRTFAAVALPPLLGPAATALALVNLAMLAWRLAMRAACTAHVHGWREGVRAVPRAAVGNVINAAAAWLACRQYLETARSGRAPLWDKTAHRFPAAPDA